MTARDEALFRGLRLFISGEQRAGSNSPCPDGEQWISSLYSGNAQPELLRHVAVCPDCARRLQRFHGRKAALVPPDWQRIDSAVKRTARWNIIKKLMEAYAQLPRLQMRQPRPAMRAPVSGGRSPNRLVMLEANLTSKTRYAEQPLSIQAMLAEHAPDRLVVRIGDFHHDLIGYPVLLIVTSCEMISSLLGITLPSDSAGFPAIEQQMQRWLEDEDPEGFAFQYFWRNSLCMYGCLIAENSAAVIYLELSDADARVAFAPDSCLFLVLGEDAPAKS